MAIVIPASCGGGGSDDIPKPTPTPVPTPTPEPEPEPEPLPDVSGMDNLMVAILQVDQETDLLSGITLNNGAELTKTEIEKDGQRSEVADPHHFTPEYPGTCTIILSVKGSDGTTTEYKAENLTIKPLDYADGTLEAVDIIEKTYPWYNNLQQSTKDFIYPHLLASYAASNWSRQDNRVHIIMGEAADTDDMENIGEPDFDFAPSHAYE